MLTDDLLEGADAIANYIGKTTRSTYHLLAAGQLPHVKKGRRIYARKSELEAAFRSEAA
jgi:lactate dehydrogenase-like 2-hydroxyacid dehydrogenase